MTKEDTIKMNKLLRDISNSWTRKEAEQDYVKGVIDEMHAEYNIPKKVLRRLARTFHKQNFDEEVAEFEAFEELHEELLKLRKKDDDDEAS